MARARYPPNPAPKIPPLLHFARWRGSADFSSALRRHVDLTPRCACVRRRRLAGDGQGLRIRRSIEGFPPVTRRSSIACWARCSSDHCRCSIATYTGSIRVPGWVSVSRLICAAPCSIIPSIAAGNALKHATASDFPPHTDTTMLETSSVVGVRWRSQPAL